MSIAILSMTHRYNNTISQVDGDQIGDGEELAPTRPNSNDYPFKNNSQIDDPIVEYEPIYKSWTPKMQDLILSVYFFGYSATHFVGSIISAKIGTRWMMLLCLTGSTLSAIMLAPLAGLSPYALIADRIVGGAFAGALYPMIHEIIGTWIPTTERTLLAALTHSGNIFGLVGTYGIGGFLASEKFGDYGWTSFLYLTGGVGLIAIVFWIAMGFSSPTSHPYISKKEKQLLQKDHSSSSTKKRIPYISILTSVPVWTASFAHFSTMFIFYAMLTGHAKYLKNVFDITITKASLFSMIPFISYFLVNLVYPPTIDYLRVKKGYSINRLRKMTTLVSILGACTFVTAVGFFNKNQLYYVIATMTVGMGFLGMNVSGYFTSIIDLSPTYAGIIMGVMNTCGSIAGFLQPIIASLLQEKYENPIGWRYTFIMTACVSLVTSLPFIIFGSSELQPWGTSQDNINEYQKLEIDEIFDNEGNNISNVDYRNSEPGDDVATVEN